MDFEEIKEEFGDCDWMRAFLNGYAVDGILWLMSRVEELEQLVKEQECTRRICKDMMRLQEQGVRVSKIMNGFIEDKEDKAMTSENCGTQVEAREGQVNQELNNAENAAGRLIAKIDELEAMLLSVLHEIEPSPSKSMETKESKLSLVPLASRIENHYILLQTLGTRVEDILDKLEIR